MGSVESQIEHARVGGLLENLRFSRAHSVRSPRTPGIKMGAGKCKEDILVDETVSHSTACSTSRMRTKRA
jgi:hypothetical protein